MLPPLCVVVVLSMIKDAYEDYLRHKKDNEENNSNCLIIKNSYPVKSKWSDVRVGDIL